MTYMLKTHLFIIYYCLFIFTTQLFTHGNPLAPKLTMRVLCIDFEIFIRKLTCKQCTNRRCCIMLTGLQRMLCEPSNSDFCRCGTICCALNAYRYWELQHGNAVLKPQEFQDYFPFLFAPFSKQNCPKVRFWDDCRDDILIIDSSVSIWESVFGNI